MRPARWMAASAVVVAAFLGCAPALADDEAGPVPGTATLTGSVSLREPAEIPAGSVLTVTVEDTSRADAPAVPLAQTQIDLADQRAPIPFALPYPNAALDQRAVYTARARVTMGDRLLFTTTESNRVDVFNPAPADLVLSAVAPPAPTPDAALTDTYWKLVDVDGAPVLVAPQQREPHLVFNGADSRFAGSGGVNRLMGGYTGDGDTLTFGQTATTMMAGPPEAMAQEQLIVAALQRVRGFRIAGSQLTLIDGGGTPVLRAVAVALN